MTSHARIIIITINIPLDITEGGLFFKVIVDTKSKRKKKLNPCGKTTQFSLGLHC
jgi:hypothetical protein